jgi:hypothetical protein
MKAAWPPPPAPAPETSHSFPSSRIFLPWRWRRHVPQKRPFSQDSHGATSQKALFFTDVFKWALVRVYCIAVTSRECLSGDSSETRNCRQNTHLCKTRSWKLCWNAWEPHRASAVEITPASPVPQQAFVSERILDGNVCSFKWVLR